MSQWSKEDAEKTILDVKKKAMTDADFRSLCLSDAGAAIQAVSGKELPEEMKIKFIENDGSNMTIVLPDMGSGEMSEDDLEKVAGGTTISTLTFLPFCR